MLFAMVAGPEDAVPRHKEESVPVLDEAKEMEAQQVEMASSEDEVVEQAEDELQQEEWEELQAAETSAAPAEGSAAPAREEDRLDDDLFLRYYRLPGNNEQEKRIKQNSPVRAQLVANHMNLVRFLAKKFSNRGEPLEDLIGVGTIGLMHAIDRFDPERGIRFATFATPTIVGEIKRHFRDHGWAVKVPRRLQEINLAANKALEQLTLKLNRTPTVQEIADTIGVGLEETLEGMELGHLYELASLDNEMGDDDEESRSRLEDYVGKEDVAFEEYGLRSRLEDAIGRLSPRERKIIILRFFKGWSQTDVARELRISQMHVSRLQHKALARLREMVESEEV